MTAACLLLLASLGSPESAAGDAVTRVGRFDLSSGEAKCSWSGSTIGFVVKGKSFSAVIDSAARNFVQVEVNGRPTDVWELKPGRGEYSASLPLTSNEVRLVRRTEASSGTISFVSVEPPAGGRISPLPPKPRLMEFIGDSITCGFGNEGKTQNDPFLLETENAYQTYGQIAARNLNADAQQVCWSGRKMWPDFTMPEIYDRTIATEDGSVWDFAKARKPDLVLIHLATNDFGQNNPDEAQWTKAYKAFVAKLRGLYPKAAIYCAMGSMMSDGWPPDHKALTTLRGYLTKMVGNINSEGDRNVRVIEFDQQKMEDGIGSAWHPNVTTHKKMAARLVEKVKADLGW